MKTISRRDFLKLATVAGGALLTTGVGGKMEFPRNQSETSPNVIVIVFDALSARNMSLYGYPRETTPNLERFARHATVYHSHYAGGSFTSPGTASLLTGTYPWTHRAYNLFGMVDRDLTGHNLFNVMGPRYQRLAFSQNLLPNYFFEQFSRDLDVILNPASFSVDDYLLSFGFKNDRQMSYRAQEFLATEHPEVLSHSLIFGPTINYLLERLSASQSRDEFPVEMPQVENGAFYYTLSGIMNGLAETMDAASSPFFHYHHLMAPHAPYRPDHRFHGQFDNDNFKLVDKPRSRVDAGYKQVRLDEDRNLYDAFIANLDLEFGILTDRMKEKGIFDNSYVIVTSDHGEMFERGVEGHLSRDLYEPGIHIPLLVSTPGQNSRKDVYSPTNSVDILPTLAHLAHEVVPDWCEGKILPGLGGVEEPERSIFTVEAKSNSAFTPIKKATLAMRKGNYKLTHYMGYGTEDFFELYDIHADPEELIDLAPSQPAFFKPMKDELLDTLEVKNKMFLAK